MFWAKTISSVPAPLLSGWSPPAASLRLFYGAPPESAKRQLLDLSHKKPTWISFSFQPSYRALQTYGVSSIQRESTSKDDNHWLTFHLLDTRLHRADADALVLADGYVEMRRRRELAALLDKASQASPAAQGASHTANPTEKGADNE